MGCTCPIGATPTAKRGRAKHPSRRRYRSRWYLYLCAGTHNGSCAHARNAIRRYDVRSPVKRRFVSFLQYPSGSTHTLTDFSVAHVSTFTSTSTGTSVLKTEVYPCCRSRLELLVSTDPFNIKMPKHQRVWGWKVRLSQFKLSPGNRIRSACNSCKCIQRSLPTSMKTVRHVYVSLLTACPHRPLPKQTLQQLPFTSTPLSAML